MQSPVASPVEYWQHTIAEPAVLAGIGLHSGRHVRMALRPAEPGTGIVFVRKDLAGDNRIAARVENVADLRLGATLRNAAGAEAATVEHLMAALAGLGVDNILVELEGPELPAVDGSSAPFAALLRRAGLRRQGAPRAVLRILREVSVELDGRRASLSPADRPVLDVAIEFPAPIGRQEIVFDSAADDFEADLAGARTFGFMAEAEALRASQRALGASLDNAVIIADGAVANPEGLRFADEFVRHKALDALGDLALAGAPILGRYRAERPGHALTLALLRAVLADPSAWRLEGADDSARSPAAAGAPEAG